MTKLDLHKTRHEDARREVIHFIEDNWDCGELVDIITGNSNNMRNIVMEVLQEYNVEYSIGCMSGYNNGYMRVQL